MGFRHKTFYHFAILHGFIIWGCGGWRPVIKQPLLQLPLLNTPRNSSRGAFVHYNNFSFFLGGLQLGTSVCCLLVVQVLVFISRKACYLIDAPNCVTY